MKDSIIEAIKAVSELNEEFYNVTGEGYTPFVYITNSCYSCSIEFMYWSVWDSESDEREYVDKNEEIYEPLKGYILKCIKTHRNILTKFLEGVK